MHKVGIVLACCLDAAAGVQLAALHRVGPSAPAAQMANCHLGSVHCHQGATRLPAPSMFSEPPPPEEGGSPDEELDKLLAALTPMQKRLKTFGPFAMDSTANTLVVVSTLLTWFVTPPIGKVGTVLSVTAGGVAGRKLGQSMRSQRKAVLPAAIAELLKSSGVRDMKPLDVQELGERYGYTPEELEDQIASFYGRYLGAMVGYDENVKTAEVSTLAALRRGLGLGWNSTAAMHAAQVGL